MRLTNRASPGGFVNEDAAEKLAEPDGLGGIGAQETPEASPSPPRTGDRALPRRAPHPLRLPRGTMVRAFARRDFLVTRSYRLPFVLDTISGVFLLGTYYFISRTFKSVPTESLQRRAVVLRLRRGRGGDRSGGRDCVHRHRESHPARTARGNPGDSCRPAAQVVRPLPWARGISLRVRALPSGALPRPCVRLDRT